MKKIQLKIIVPLLVLIVGVIAIVKPENYLFLSLSLTSLMISYIGILRRKNKTDTIAIILGIVLFLVCCFYFLV